MREIGHAIFIRQLLLWLPVLILVGGCADTARPVPTTPTPEAHAAPATLAAGVATVPGALPAPVRTDLPPPVLTGPPSGSPGGAPTVTPFAPPARPTPRPTLTLRRTLAPGLLQAIAARAPDDVWVAGETAAAPVDSGLVAHWDGDHWTSTVLPQAGAGRYFLYGITAPAADDVWVVGEYQDGGPRRYLMLHGNGKAWSVVPNVGGDFGALTGLAAVAPDDVWAVGYAGDGALILHWDGHDWRRVPAPAGTERLGAIAALHGNDIWAVGGDGHGDVRTIHWDGSTWKQVPSPSLRQGAVCGASLTGVAAIASNNVWAIGFASCNQNAYRILPFILHWDGAAWSQSPSPQDAGYPLFGEQVDRLAGIAAFAADDIWVVGDRAFQPLLLHWNGHDWRALDCPAQPSYGHPDRQGPFFAVAAVSATELWAVGGGTFAEGPEHVLDGYVRRYNRAACAQASPAAKP